MARNGVAELTTTLLSHDQVRDLVERMLKSSGRRVDLSSPFVDAVLADGSRLHVVIPDITRDHWYVNVRKFVVKADSMDDLVRLGTLTRQAARFLEAAVASGLNVLVAGGTQAGKTTLLNCLASAVPPRERIVTCEEVFELHQPPTVAGRPPRALRWKTNDPMADWREPVTVAQLLRWDSRANAARYTLASTKAAREIGALLEIGLEPTVVHTRNERTGAIGVELVFDTPHTTPDDRSNRTEVEHR